MTSKGGKSKAREKRGDFDLTKLLNMESFGSEQVEEENDEELEKELLQLMSSGESPKTRRPRPAPKKTDLESMVAACMKDIRYDAKCN